MKSEITRSGNKKYITDNWRTWPSSPSKIQQYDKLLYYESQLSGGTVQNTCFPSHLAASAWAHGPGPTTEKLSRRSSIPKQEM